jgi:branched-subunit amino acid aminotransferase/4-amino-4-deoxychorismate lyase
MSVLGDFYRLERGELIPLIEAKDSSAEVQLKVADSWLVEDGKVRSLEAHFERFESWVIAEDANQKEFLPGLFAEVRRLLPRNGRWFPRLEYHGEEQPDKRLFLRLRPAPEPIESVRLWLYSEVDPRANPTVKGPDLSLCQQLRRHANMMGADEAVLTDSRGFVSEAALSSLVWWRGDTLCSSDGSSSWLPSITRREVFEIASQMGFETQLESARPEEIAKLPVWALSSLNGIMPVTSWVELNDNLPVSAHYDAFCKRLKMLGAIID